MANYYDTEDFDVREGILDEGLFDEGIYDEANYDEGMFDEASRNRKRRPVRVPSSLGRPSNFGSGIGRGPSPASGNFVTKSELKSSLNSISNQVNDLKKSSLTIASSIKRLDDGYEKVIRSIAKKDRSQDSLMSNSTMMSLISTMINKPTLNASALTIVQADATKGTTEHIEVKPDQDPIQVDLTKTLLFTIMPMMMNSNSSGGDNSSMMMLLMMVLLLGNKPASGTTAAPDNTLLIMLPMMMMNKK